MKLRIKLLFFVLFAPISLTVLAAQQQFTSGNKQTTLLELYTSEGCSSCPPADRWLSGLKENPQLWKTLFPVAFHVDYWDELGWPDRFADARFSQRQRLYSSVGGVRSVYTPGFIINGKEWRSWFRNPNLQLESGASSGELQLTMSANTLDATYRGTFDIQTLTLNVAWLGFAQSSEIKSGENSGKRLTHDFVILQFEQQRGTREQNQFSWHVLATPPKQATAIVSWVSRIEHPAPIQTTGGWLTND